MFTGSCHITLNGSGTCSTTLDTIIKGELKKSASEAECSAAAKTIAFLESVLFTEVVDLNYPILLENEALLNQLRSLKIKFDTIMDFALSEWRSLIDKLKGLVKTQYEVCKEMDVDVDEKVFTQSSQMIDETVGDIMFMYNFCTICLDQPSS